MVVSGQRLFYSGKVVVFGHCCIRAKVVVFEISGCIPEKVVIIGQSGFIGASVPVFGQSGCILAKLLYLGEMVKFGQSGYTWVKVVAFVKKWL